MLFTANKKLSSGLSGLTLENSLTDSTEWTPIRNDLDNWPLCRIWKSVELFANVIIDYLNCLQQINLVDRD